MQNNTKQSVLCDQLSYFERNNYYFGKMLTVRDFTEEQLYLNEKRWILNRFGLDWGVLCGLKVKPHPNEAHKVLVEPGFALDSYGHEIMVCKEQTVDLTTARDECPPETPNLYYISVKYHECAVNPSPVPVEDCGEVKAECEYNRIQETYHFVVTRQKPAFTHVLDSELKDMLQCETDCLRFLENPSAVISERCPERPECEVIPLACVCYDPGIQPPARDIDMSPENRKLVFSNAILYELIRCLLQEQWKTNAAGYDRRRHVPLLAHTIKGLTYMDGKNKEFYFGTHPYRITSDGDYIWITDTEDAQNQLWRINRKSNQPEGEWDQQRKFSGESNLRLEKPGWGIAYDGLHMWITHHDSEKNNPDDPDEEPHGTLTRINVCTLERWNIKNLKNCRELSECLKFPATQAGTDDPKVGAYPGEIVYHDGYIYVAHTKKKAVVVTQQPEKDEEEEYQGEPGERRRRQPERTGDSYELWLSRIDPVKGCQIETIPVNNDEDEYEPNSEILALVSDGEAIWVTYEGKVPKNYRGEVAPVVRKIETPPNEKARVLDLFVLEDGEYPRDMVFDGTHLWVTHNDGVSKINIQTYENDCAMCGGGKRGGERAQTALTYGGGEYLWSAEPRLNEAGVNRIDIYSGDYDGSIEIKEFHDKEEARYEISDMQFDGTFIYIAASFQEGENKQGIIHRLLP